MATNNAINLSSSGIVAYNGTGTFSGRTITGTSNQISVSNGTGTAGNPTLSLTSTIQVSGISFDSGSNTLSTYTTGTFSPTITNSTGAPTLTYTTQVGRYTQIGNRVHVNIVVILATYAAGTGNVQVASLPFTSNATANNNITSSIAMQNVTFGVAVFFYVGSLAPSATVMTIPGMRSATTSLNLDAAGPGGTANFYLTFVYEV